MSPFYNFGITIHLAAGYESVTIHTAFTDYLISHSLKHFVSFRRSLISFDLLSIICSLALEVRNWTWSTKILYSMSKKIKNLGVGDEETGNWCKTEYKFKHSRRFWFGLYLMFFVFTSWIKWLTDWMNEWMNE